jgi:2,3-diketo-5-methylthio-1-phosphopentane phosphatase/HAD superfamily hydrolase (TIGR01549 family)
MTHYPTVNNPRTLILCDFDGTVSIKDTVNRLIRGHLTNPAWRFEVKRYMRGEIGSRAVYEALAPMMKMTPQDLEQFVLEHAALDPGFPPFLEWARANGIDVKIVSDGFDATIRTLFRNHGVEGLDIFANRLQLEDTGHVTIETPHANLQCGVCGTCKLNVLRSFRSQYDRILLVGDGESDRHAASEADGVLALDDLFIYCVRHGISAMRIEGFHEVLHLLTRNVRAVTFDMDGTLIDSITAITAAFNHMFTALGYPLMTESEVARKTSLSLKDFLHTYLRPEERDEGLHVFRSYYDTIFLDQTHLMPGVRQTLQVLNGSMIQGIVTNKRGRYARLLAEHLGLIDSMMRIIGAEDGFRAKPAADMFEEFMRSAGTDKAGTVYVGDAPIDVQAAANAGIDAFVVAGPIFSAEELALHRPRRVLRHITELPAALQPLI